LSGNVGASATPGNSARVKVRKSDNDRLLGTSNLEEGAMWHIFSKQEVCTEKQSLLYNGSVTSNNGVSFGSGVFCAVCLKAI
jgi:hypothetical protein